jgi:hypothetical protein
VLYTFDPKGNLKRVTDCVSNAPHWSIYHRACRESPGLVQAMKQTITDEINSGRFLDTAQRFPNSSWLGREILQTWSHIDEWNEFCHGDWDASGALFGEIMWVVFCEASDEWCTTLTSNADPTREERVYWRYPAQR